MILKERITLLGNEILAEIERLKRDVNKSNNYEISETKLNSLQKIVKEMQFRIQTDNLPDRSLRYGYLRRYISDSWPLQSKLGEKAAEFEEMYMLLD